MGKISLLNHQEYPYLLIAHVMLESEIRVWIEFFLFRFEKKQGLWQKTCQQKNLMEELFFAHQG